MKAIELTEKLLAEGCNQNNFAVLSRGTGDDITCLDKKGGEWIIFYCERGRDSEPFFTFKNEDEACDFFYDYILKQQHWHIVGFFKTESFAIALEDKLKAIGVKPIRNDIPAYSALNDSRYRVFVVGKDIFKARECLGDIRINYE